MQKVAHGETECDNWAKFFPSEWNLSKCRGLSILEIEEKKSCQEL